MSKQPSVPSPIWGSALRKAMESSRDRDLRTQTGLARKSGVAQSTIGRILRGEVNPQADNLERIAQALRIPVTQLFGVAPVEPVTALPRDPRYDETVAALAAVEEILRRFEAVIARWRRQWGYSR